MRQRNKPRVVRRIICLLFLAGIQQSLAEAPDPAQVLAEMLGKFEAIHAKFIQKKVQRTLGEATNEETQSGEFWLQKPDRFRVETGPPLSQTVVSDGANLWTHDRDLEQVIISDLEADLIRLPILLLGGKAKDLAAVFSVARHPSGSEYRSEDRSGDEARNLFLLTPYDDQGILTSVAIVFVHSIPETIILEDAMQQRTLIELSNVNLTPEFTGTEFLFETSEPVDVIDDRH